MGVGTLDKFTISNRYLGSAYHLDELRSFEGAALLESPPRYRSLPRVGSESKHIDI
jgi:hypothetical protein